MCKCKKKCNCGRITSPKGKDGINGTNGTDANGYPLYQGAEDAGTTHDIYNGGVGRDIDLGTLPANTNIYHSLTMHIDASDAHNVTIQPKLAGVAIANKYTKHTSAPAVGGKSYLCITYTFVTIGNGGVNLKVNVLSSSNTVGAVLSGWDWNAWII